MVTHGFPHNQKPTQLLDAQERMKQKGINSSQLMEHLYLAKDPIVSTLVAELQLGWLLPRKCSLSNTRNHTMLQLSVALKNLLHCDVVVDIDRFTDQMLPQLWYHAPHMRNVIQRAKLFRRRNRARGAKQ
eukprot:6083057-Heterocapsa_arctica.AAC.1